MDLRSIGENLPVLHDQSISVMDTIARTWVQTNVECYKVFVEEPEKFGGLLLYPWHIMKFDPIIISGDNINTFNPEETTNSIEVILYRIGKITLTFTSVTDLKKVQEKLQFMKRIKQLCSGSSEEEKEAKK